MKNRQLVFICIMVLFSFGCKKEEQKFIIDNGYTITEGEVKAEDYRNKFEGFYLLKCSGVSWEISYTYVRLLMTRPNFVILSELVGKGMSDNRKENLVAEIDSLGRLNLPMQKMKTSFGYSLNKTFTGSGQINSVKDSITINLSVEVGSDTLTCTCAGKRN